MRAHRSSQAGHPWGRTFCTDSKGKTSPGTLLRRSVGVALLASSISSVVLKGPVTSWLGWLSSRVLAAGVVGGISVLLLTDKLTLWCSCCGTVTSPGLAVLEACRPSALVPTMGVVGMEASSISVVWAPVALSAAAVKFFSRLVSGMAVVTWLKSEASFG